MTKSNETKHISNSPFGGWGASFGIGGFFFLAALLFFGLAYPHHLHYQEQYQLFLFDSTYVWDIIKFPGGVADLLGRFCTQFFLFAWVGAFIIALLLSAVQLLILSLARWGKFYALSILPTCLLWVFLLDENALLGGVWAVLLTLLATWIFDKLPCGWLRRILLVGSVPVLYWIVGPVCVLFFILQSPRPKSWYIGSLVLLILVPIIIAHFIPVPAAKLWYGIHYYRYPAVVPTMLWGSVASVVLLVLAVRMCQRWTSTSSKFILDVCSFVLVAACMGGFIFKNSNFKAEKTMKYDFMACHQQWNRILQAINSEKPNNQIGVTVQNLALGMRGMLVDRMLDYNQNGLLGLLPDVERDATSPMPTAEAFYQLGMVYVAQRTVFEAQEAILDFQKSARCYKRLAQTNLIIGSYEVSRKYLLALQKTLFYSDWATETLALLGDEKAIAKHPEYGRLRKMADKENYFFSDHITPDMLKSLYLSNKDNQLAYQYMLASFVLTGDRENFLKFTSQNR